jgi:hypothetical protein
LGPQIDAPPIVEKLSLEKRSDFLKGPNNGTKETLKKLFKHKFFRVLFNIEFYQF